MKVLLLNGSPKKNGNTNFALSQVAKTLLEEGIDSEIIQIGSKPIRDCIACNACMNFDSKCIFKDDVVNEFLEKAKTADGFVFGSPVYFAHPSGALLSAMNRMFYAGGGLFRHKPAASVLAARRAGTTASFDVINKHFTISEMPVVSSNYWNSVHGWTGNEAQDDIEGLQTMKILAKNMAWLLKCIDVGKSVNVSPPESEERIFTNFIR